MRRLAGVVRGTAERPVASPGTRNSTAAGSSGTGGFAGSGAGGESPAGGFGGAGEGFSVVAGGLGLGFFPGWGAGFAPSGGFSGWAGAGAGATSGAGRVSGCMVSRQERWTPLGFHSGSAVKKASVIAPTGRQRAPSFCAAVTGKGTSGARASDGAKVTRGGAASNGKGGGRAGRT